MKPSIHRLLAAARKMVLCFPDGELAPGEQRGFDVPAYVVRELRQAVDDVDKRRDHVTV